MVSADRVPPRPAETGPLTTAVPAAAESDLTELAEAVGHRFGDMGRLAGAVTHPSLGGLERASGGVAPGAAYERLEFLGDRVLGLAIAQWLLERYPDEREGDLARRHAALVRRDALGRVAEAIGLGRHLRLSPGEAEGGGRANRTILADACEAVIGALFLDGGLEAAVRFIRTAWLPMIMGTDAPPQEPKTLLQEWVQGSGRPLPAYQTIGQSGPAHDPRFEVRLSVADQEPVTATGRSKRAAERAAAVLMLRQMGVPIDE